MDDSYTKALSLATLLTERTSASPKPRLIKSYNQHLIQMKYSFFSLLLAASFLLGGCAAPEALVHPKQGMPDAKPLPGKATLVVIRERMFKGSAGNWSVSFDGRELSRLSIGNYLIKEIEPGEHSLSNVAFVEAPTIFVAEAGRIYYFNYDLPFLGGDAFTLVEEGYAQGLMQKYTRVRLLF